MLWTITNYENSKKKYIKFIKNNFEKRNEKLYLTSASGNVLRFTWGSVKKNTKNHHKMIMMKMMMLGRSVGVHMMLIIGGGRVQYCLYFLYILIFIAKIFNIG